MAEETNDSAIDVTNVDKTKKTVLLLIVLSVLVMVLTPVITIFSIRMMTQKTEAKTEASDHVVNKEIVLPQIQVNVAETNGTRFVQIEIVLDVSDAEMVSIFEDQTPENSKGRLKRIMATIISIISDKNLPALVTKEAKSRLATEIKNAINDLIRSDTDGIVTEVYFYSFLIQ